MITSYTTTRLDDVTLVAVTSDLVGEVFFHWYLDGMYMGATSVASRTFQIPPGSQAEIEVKDTLDADFDPLSFAPAAAPARKTLWWVRSTDANVAKYRIEQQKDGGDWTVLADIPAGPSQWEYWYTTARLDDLAEYSWRIAPYDAAGNPGTALSFTQEKIVRQPDAPAFSVALNAGPQTVTFT